MGHHGPRYVDDEMNRGLIEKIKTLSLQSELSAKLESIDSALREDPAREELGSTGRFPDGMLTPSDEGEIAYRIGAKAGQVIIDFGQPVAWVGFDADAAMELAKTVKKWARRARAQEVAGAA